VTEKVLPYDRSIVPQETGWWCGPASCQVVLNSRGIIVTERDMMLELEALEHSPGWDDQDGTDHIGQVTAVLSGRLGVQYVTRSIQNDPPTSRQVDTLWTDVCLSIDAGFGVVANIMVPPSNYPRGTRGSQSPRYGGGTVYHYFSIMGYADEGQGRHVWVADSGFQPQGYWCSLEQMASMIAGKGYTACPVAPAAAEDDPQWRDILAQFVGPV
jgi:hypothetical protein